MENLIVLRDLRVATSRDPFSAGVRGWPPKFFGPPEPKIDVIAADAADMEDVTGTPGVIAVGTVVPTRLISPISVDDTARGTSWGIEAIGADRSDFDGAGVTVAILDTGIDHHHLAFAGVALVEEDFTGTDKGDRNGHGTHCAGTVLGRDLAGNRIGIARGVTNALIGKILRDDGTGSSEMILRGIVWAVQEGANVVSMSVGLDFPGHVARLVSDDWPTDLATSRALEAYRANLRLFDALMAMLWARDEFGTGSVVVAAAGNESRRDVKADYTIGSSLPAAAHGVLSVAAVRDLGPGGLDVAAFSNTLPDVAAPGVDIISARRGRGTCAMSGTSMACPHVAGAAALWWQSIGDTRRRVNARIVEAKLLASARTDRLPHGAPDADVGAGVVMAP